MTDAKLIKKMKEQNQSQGTELKIKEAARAIFQEKGFAATRTRDIAEAADINLALLNYYFRSKKKLYDIIMLETMQGFFGQLLPIVNDEATSLKEKISLLVEAYIDMLSENPNVVVFIINDVRANPKAFTEKIGVLEKIKNSVFILQFMKAIQEGEVPPINPIHLMMNLLGLVIFPFIVTPMISTVTDTSSESILKVIEERKRLIPLWIDAMLTVK